MKKRVFLSLAAITALGIIGCGGGGGASSPATEDSGFLVDGNVSGANYICGSKTGVTEAITGKFTCPTDVNITFYAGSVRLGSIETIPVDKKVFPQDLLGKSRSDINDGNVTKMAQFLQTLDSDGNTANGIEINTTIKESLSVSAYSDKNITQDDFDINATVISLGLTLVNDSTAKTHLESTLESVKAEVVNSFATSLTSEPEWYMVEYTVPESAEKASIVEIKNISFTSTSYSFYAGDYDTNNKVNTSGTGTYSLVKNSSTYLLNDINFKGSLDTEDWIIWREDSNESEYYDVNISYEGKITNGRLYSDKNKAIAYFDEILDLHLDSYSSGIYFTDHRIPDRNLYAVMNLGSAGYVLSKVVMGRTDKNGNGDATITFLEKSKSTTTLNDDNAFPWYIGRTQEDSKYLTFDNNATVLKWTRTNDTTTIKSYVDCNLTKFDLATPAFSGPTEGNRIYFDYTRAKAYYDTLISQ